ncbi:MAG: ribulose-phosphate 3-epimerase [Bacilli bacterium]|nr:ribulose-phosphate 3-epimerase [Bacilli bacterium]
MAKVAPSILSANFNNLIEEIKSVDNAKYLHIDVMDGKFVPNITIGPLVMKNFKKEINNIVMDVHLMIADPVKYAPDFVKAGADIITFHYEAVKYAEPAIDAIRELGVKVGISIKPLTDINVLDDLLDKVDLILIMSVEPGFGGQAFIPSALDKIKYLADKRKHNGYNYLIEVDGGINKETAKQCIEAGVDILVAGSYIFSSNNRKALIEEIENDN